MKLKRIAVAFSLGIALAQAAIAMPIYNPIGAQSGVAVATVTAGGWTQCYLATMDQPIGTNAESALAGCGGGDLLMMAGRQTGSDTLLALATGGRAQVLFNTGKNSTTHTVNGAEWWYSSDWSWGFTALGDTVDNSECDISNASPLSMCLQTSDSFGGYRINDIVDLTVSTEFEKLLFVASSSSTAAVPEPGSIGLIGLALAGLGWVRRRKSKAG